jgi:hypothetical protein
VRQQVIATLGRFAEMQVSRDNLMRTAATIRV